MGEWYEVKGAVRPAEIDTTSSQYYVYESKDIEKFEEKDDDQKVVRSGWKYMQRRTPKEEWVVDATAQNKANIDALMLGLTDLYELQLGEI